MGIGDDAAIINLPLNSKTQLVVASDTLVEEVHFPRGASAYQIAQRALCVNLSDMAAMGAAPRWFTLALTLPQGKANEQWLKGFSAGLSEIAIDYNCALIGGDTTAGPLATTITMLGEVPLGGGLVRSAAANGDRVYVTGLLGDGAAGLLAAKKTKSFDYMDKSVSDRLLQSFYKPHPKIDIGLKIRGLASACIDISDGLVADLGHICKSSGVAASVNTSRLPIHPDLEANFQGQCVDWALFGGDDYQLCFTVSAEHYPMVDDWILRGELDATWIGSIIPCSDDNPAVLVDGVKSLERERGFDHFDQ
ncbi:MAG: thiamine-phosphate kinase [Porticoccaceae bacterium]|nr:thiamine-phosphate kinase [Porticoccaceae bacterium]